MNEQKMTLNNQQLLYLKEVTDFILQDEEEMELLEKSHIYQYALRLAYAMRDAEIIWVTVNMDGKKPRTYWK